MLVYVYYIIIVSNDESAINKLKSSSDAKFKLKDLGALRFFTGLEIARSNRGIFISQRPYALQLLSDIGFLSCKAVSTPMEANLKLSQDDSELIEDTSLYRRMIGKLIYLTITRPDSSYPVNRLNQFLAKPRLQHIKSLII